MAQAGLTVRRTCRADTKVEHSEPTFRIRCGWRLTDKSYSRDNRLVPPKSSYRRRSSAPRCRLTLSWWWRSCQGFSCSLIKKVRELGSNRWETEHLTINIWHLTKIYFWLCVNCKLLTVGFLTVWTNWGRRNTKVFLNCFNLRCHKCTVVHHGGLQ